MSDRHTPGPWFVKYRHMDIQVCAPDPEDDTPWNIARVDNYAGPGDATEANAHLIAAAPEMLAALRLALDTCEYSHVRKVLREAIAKAEGRE